MGESIEISDTLHNRYIWLPFTHSLPVVRTMLFLVINMVYCWCYALGIDVILFVIIIFSYVYFVSLTLLFAFCIKMYIAWYAKRACVWKSSESMSHAQLVDPYIDGKYIPCVVLMKRIQLRVHSMLHIVQCTITHPTPENLLYSAYSLVACEEVHSESRNDLISIECCYLFTHECRTHDTEPIKEFLFRSMVLQKDISRPVFALAAIWLALNLADFVAQHVPKIETNFRIAFGFSIQYALCTEYWALESEKEV